MMKIGLALLLVFVSGTAFAQPGQDPAPPPYPPAPAPAPEPYPQPPAPAPQPPPPAGYGQPYVPPPHGYVGAQLSVDDAALLQRGEISDGEHIGGAVVSLFFGFGIGQAVQGRYSETGWIFTLGEAASIALLVYGVVEAFDDCFAIDETSCDSRGNDRAGAYIATGLIGALVFRVWEVIDAFGGPTKHNRRVRDLKMRLGIPVPMYTQKLAPFVNRTRDGGATAGLTFRF